jgi:hypothetical protein
MLEAEAQVVDVSPGPRERDYRLKKDEEHVEDGERPEDPKVDPIVDLRPCCERRHRGERECERARDGKSALTDAGSLLRRRAVSAAVCDAATAKTVTVGIALPSSAEEPPDHTLKSASARPAAASPTKAAA